jgi:hypothetical protein
MATINPFDVFLEPDATHFPSPTIRFSTRSWGRSASCCLPACCSRRSLPRSRANAAAEWREPRTSAHAGSQTVLRVVGGRRSSPHTPLHLGGRSRWSRPAPRPAP